MILVTQAAWINGSACNFLMGHKVANNTKSGNARKKYRFHRSGEIATQRDGQDDSGGLLTPR